jgi:hypothetical protein
MPLDKHAAAPAGRFLVTFSVPAEAGAVYAELVGEFTSWSPVPMQPTGDGGHGVTVELDGGAAYRFRYLLDGDRWENDWAADKYTANDYGGDDSIVDLTAPAEVEPPPQPPTRAKRPSRRKVSAADAADAADAAGADAVIDVSDAIVPPVASAAESGKSKRAPRRRKSALAG